MYKLKKVVRPLLEDFFLDWKQRRSGRGNDSADWKIV